MAYEVLMPQLGLTMEGEPSPSGSSTRETL